MGTQHYLVTGGAGYVGSHVVAELLDRGHAVTVFDNLSQGHREAVPPSAEFILGDLSDREAVQGALRRRPVDAVLHFAANSLVGESMRRPMAYVGDNVTNGINLIDGMIGAGISKLVLSSTCAIFGLPSRVPIDEDLPKEPVNSYGESKLILERILRWADEVHGLRSACLRYFNAAGAHPAHPIGEDHQPETHLIPIALEAALGHRPRVDIFGDDYLTPDGTCVRDYIHVCDLADAHVRVLDVLAERSVQYNVGIGRGYSVREVLDSVRRVTGRAVPEKIAPRRVGDPPVLIADPARIKAELGWAPRHADLDDIVATAWAWRRRHPHGYRPLRAAG